MATSASIFTLLAEAWGRVAPAWRWALGVFVAVRLFYTVWSVVVLLLVPYILQNLDLFGVPMVAAFDMTTGARHVYSRVVNGETLTFRQENETNLTDVETGTVWDVRDGRALSGASAGATLAQAEYGVEDVFPYLGVQPATNPLLAVWQRFDANWFLKIARQGYASTDGSTVYLPLYPLLIRVVGTVLVGNDLLAAMVISNLALVVALYLMYRMTAAQFDAAAAKRAVVYLALFPTAFFFLAAYTESLFLVLALAALNTAQKNKFGWAAVLAALAALTRLQGVLLFVPLLYMVWVQLADRKLKLDAAVLRALVPLALVPLATATFLAYTNLSLLASYEGELHARFVLPWENLWAAVSLILAGRAAIADIANLFFTVIFGVMCLVVWQKLPRALALYTVLMFLAPLFRMTTTQPLVSMSRYVLILFPVFMLWGDWGKNSWVNRAILYPSFLLSAYFSAQFWMWGWVA